MEVLILGSKEYPTGKFDKLDDPYPSGGIENYIENLVHALKTKNVNISIITRKGTKLINTQMTDNISVYRVPFIRGFYFRNISFNFFSFLKALTMKFDVILSNGEISNIFSIFLSGIKRKPVILICHGRASQEPQYNILIGFFFRAIEILTYKMTDITITHNLELIKKLTKKYIYVKPGLNIDNLKKLSEKKVVKFKKSLGITNEKIIVFTGRLIKVKGLEYLLMALKQLKIKYKCIIVGDGHDKQHYLNLAENFELKNNIIFTGFRTDISNFLSIADVFVLPSISESLNYSMLEAAYMKVPIIVTNLGILPSNCGLIINKKNSSEIYESLTFILENKNPNKIKNMVINAKKFSGGFKWDKTAETYINMLQKLRK